MLKRKATVHLVKTEEVTDVCPTCATMNWLSCTDEGRISWNKRCGCLDYIEWDNEKQEWNAFYKDVE